MIGIVGASGYIGWALADYFFFREERVLGTYCTHERPGLVKFDLTKDFFFTFDNCEYVVLAAAYAKILFCQKNPKTAYDLNVFYTKMFLWYLHTLGIPSLFISSDAAYKPNTVYGKYKLFVEKYITEKKLTTCLFIRPGKITDDNIEKLCEVVYEDFKSRRRA